MCCEMNLVHNAQYAMQMSLKIYRPYKIHNVGKIRKLSNGEASPSVRLRSKQSDQPVGAIKSAEYPRKGVPCSP